MSLEFLLVVSIMVVALLLHLSSSSKAFTLYSLISDRKVIGSRNINYDCGGGNQL